MCRTAEKKQDLDYYDISVFVLFEIALWVSVVSDSLYHHISVVILTIVEQSLVLYPKSLILKDLAASMEYHFHCTPCQSSLLLLNLAKTSHWLMKPRKFVTPSNSKWMKPRDIHGLLGSSFFSCARTWHSIIAIKLSPLLLVLYPPSTPYGVQIVHQQYYCVTIHFTVS